MSVIIDKEYVLFSIEKKLCVEFFNQEYAKIQFMSYLLHTGRFKI